MKMMKWMWVFAMVVGLGLSTARSEVITNETFSYVGALTANGWVAFSGADGSITSDGTAASVGGGAEDVRLDFAAQVGSPVFASFDINVTTLPASGVEYSYGFRNSSGMNSRFGIASVNGGTEFGLSIHGTGSASLGSISNLALNTSYKVTIYFDGVSDHRLWVDSDGLDFDTPELQTSAASSTNNAFFIRQAGLFDNGDSSWQMSDLKIGTTFLDVAPPPPPGEILVVFDSADGFRIPEGTSQTVTATARNGVEPYAFSWSSTLPAEFYTTLSNSFTILDTAPTGSFSATINVTDDDLVETNQTINFEVATTYAVSIGTLTNGSVSTFPAGTAFAGDTVNLTATPDAGYLLEAFSVTGDDATNIPVTSASFTMPAQPVTVSASFLLNAASLTLAGYQQDFSGFVSGETIPLGWQAIGAVTSYSGDWGTGVSAGLRGNASVFGFQHTGSSGVFTQQVNLINDTGETITTLVVSYTGRVARATETRSPAYTVTLDGALIPDLAYTTSNSVDAAASATITGLSIPTGAVFRLAWTSERGDPNTGSSKQIGISAFDIKSITASEIVITFDRDDGFKVESGASSTVSAMVVGGVDPLIYTWTSTLDAVHYSTAETNFTVLSSAPLGSYSATLTVEDDNLTVSNATINFSVENKYGITLDTSTSGSITSSPAGSAFAGETVTLTATPASGYRLTGYDVEANDFSVVPVTDGVFTMPAQPVTVTPSFTLFAASLGLAGYQQDFSGFVSAETLPFGWEVEGTITSYVNDWGVGFSAGMLGSSNVFGYQHTSGSGTVLKKLNVVNDTGVEITSLSISYTGSVQRATEGRSPAYTVTLDGTEVPGLFYSTSAGVDQLVSTTITGLTIAADSVFQLVWSSDRDNLGSGSSRQIGIAAFQITANDTNAPPPVGPVSQDIASFILSGGTASISITNSEVGVSYVLTYSDTIGNTNPWILVDGPLDGSGADVGPFEDTAVTNALRFYRIEATIAP